jgi:hypothetical protein
MPPLLHVGQRLCFLSAGSEFSWERGACAEAFQVDRRHDPAEEGFVFSTFACMHTMRPPLGTFAQTTLARTSTASHCGT